MSDTRSSTRTSKRGHRSSMAGVFGVVTATGGYGPGGEKAGRVEKGGRSGRCMSRVPRAGSTTHRPRSTTGDAKGATPSTSSRTRRTRRSCAYTARPGSSRGTTSTTAKARRTRPTG